MLCSACLAIHPIMSGGKPYESSIGDLLDSKGYNGSMYELMNEAILQYLEDNGGCENCKICVQLAINTPG
jgi:hypothetical protein